MSIPLHLPDAGRIYVTQAYATLGTNDHWDLSAGSFKVMAPGPATASKDGWAEVRRLPAAVSVFRPSWHPAGFHGPVSVEVPDPASAGGPAYRVGYTGTRGAALIFALGPVNSGPPVSSETVMVAGVPGRSVTIASGWWPQPAVL